MNPKAYLKERGLTNAAAARELGVTRQYLGDVVNGRVIPGIKLAQRFESWSNGAVLAVELLNLNATPQPKVNTIFNSIKQFLNRGKTT